MVSDEGQDQNVDSCPASTASTIASNVASNTQILNVSSIQQVTSWLLLNEVTASIA